MRARPSGPARGATAAPRAGAPAAATIGRPEDAGGTWLDQMGPPEEWSAPMPQDGEPEAGSAPAGAQDNTAKPGRLGLLLSMAMFVLVVDTSLMNVSISAVVEDLHTTASGVQSAI